MALNSKSTSPDASRPRKGTSILIVDEDDDLRGGLAENLRDDGYEVLEFRNPGELPPLESLGTIDALITDYQMGEHAGITLADRFHIQHPGAIIVLITAFWGALLEAEAARRPYLRLRRKPFDYDDLTALLIP